MNTRVKANLDFVFYALTSKTDHGNDLFKGTNNTGCKVEAHSKCHFDRHIRLGLLRCESRTQQGISSGGYLKIDRSK